MNGEVEVVEDEAEAALLRAQGRAITVRSGVFAVAVAAILYALAALTG